MFVEEDGFTRFMRTAGDHPLLGADEERELCRRIREDGDEAARERLIVHNIRLVIGVARKHFAYRGDELEDTVQAGMLGLHHATELFDERRGFRFSTYATPWIYQNMQRHAQKLDTIRLPDLSKKIRLTHKNEPELTIRELAARHKVTLGKVITALHAGHVAKHLDAPVGPQDGTPLYDAVPDDALTTDELIEEGWLADAHTGLAEAVKALPADQRSVIELSFSRGMTDKEIAKELGVSAKTAFGLRKTALEALRGALAS